MQINDKKCVKTHYRIRLTDLLFLFKQKDLPFFNGFFIYTTLFFILWNYCVL